MKNDAEAEMHPKPWRSSLHCYAVEVIFEQGKSLEAIARTKAVARMMDYSQIIDLT